MSRDDLLLANYEVVDTATEQIAKYSPNCIIVVVTNPLDAMCAGGLQGFEIQQEPRHRYGRRAGYRALPHVHRAGTERSVENVTAVVMGGHGDTMVPLVRLSNVSGIPLTELMDQATIDRDRRSHAQRRRGDREVSEDRQRLLCSFGRRRRDGRVDSEGQEEGAAVRGVSRRRVRHQRPVRRRAGETGRAAASSRSTRSS